MLSVCLLPDREFGLQGKLLQKQLETENILDPMNNTALDPVPDLLKALKLYPERAEPYMVQSPLSQAIEQHCILCMLLMQSRSKEHALQLQLLPHPCCRACPWPCRSSNVLRQYFP